MKKMEKALLIVLGVLGTIADLLDFLLLPIIFLVVGLLQQFPWPYYAITIGGYFALMIALELILNLIFKALDKKYSTRFARKLEKIIARFTSGRQNSTDLPTEDN